MNKPKTVDEAISRARKYGTPTYMMLADEIERLRIFNSGIYIDRMTGEPRLRISDQMAGKQKTWLD